MAVVNIFAPIRGAVIIISVAIFAVFSIEKKSGAGVGTAAERPGTAPSVPRTNEPVTLFLPISTFPNGVSSMEVSGERALRMGLRSNSLISVSNGCSFASGAAADVTGTKEGFVVEGLTRLLIGLTRLLTAGVGVENQRLALIATFSESGSPA